MKRVATSSVSKRYRMNLFAKKQKTLLENVKIFFELSSQKFNIQYAPSKIPSFAARLPKAVSHIVIKPQSDRKFKSNHAIFMYFPSFFKGSNGVNVQRLNSVSSRLLRRETCTFLSGKFLKLTSKKSKISKISDLSHLWVSHIFGYALCEILTSLYRPKWALIQYS